MHVLLGTATGTVTLEAELLPEAGLTLELAEGDDCWKQAQDEALRGTLVVIVLKKKRLLQSQFT